MTNEELIKIREEKKLTKGAFAKLIGISPMMQGRYESGKIEIPDSIEAKVREVAAEAAPVVEKKAKKTKEPKSIKTEELIKAGEEFMEKVKDTIAKEKKATKKTKPEKRKTASKKKKPTLSIQSLMGGSLTTEEIIGRVLEVAPDVEDIYVKTEENKAYYTAKSGDGFIILWE